MLGSKDARRDCSQNTNGGNMLLRFVFLAVLALAYWRGYAAGTQQRNSPGWKDVILGILLVWLLDLAVYIVAMYPVP